MVNLETVIKMVIFLIVALLALLAISARKKGNTDAVDDQQPIKGKLFRKTSNRGCAWPMLVILLIFFVIGTLSYLKLDIVIIDNVSHIFKFKLPF